MVFEAYDKAEVTYRAEIRRLEEIALEVYHGDRGSFVKAMADAWLKADLSNKRILQPVWRAIVTKYGLEEDLRR